MPSRLHCLAIRFAVAFVVWFPFGMPLRAAEDKPATDSPISREGALSAKAISVPEGFTLTPVVSEPNISNGVAFCFDPTGRIFVAETYRVFKGVEDDREHMDWLDDDLAAHSVADRRAYLIRRKGDKISDFTSQSEQVRLIEDKNNDGIYDHSSIFSTGYNAIEDGAAAGVLWNNDRLFFACIPSLYSLRDTNGDGKADEKNTLATGFGVHFALYGHDLHGLCQGPDGKIYVSIGDRGLNVDTPEGKLYNHGSGAVLRFNPDGSELEFFATGLRNPQELAFNEFGDLFTVDNNSDSGDKARLVHIVEGMNVGWRMAFQYLDDRGPFNREKIWHTQNPEQPASIVPPLAHIASGPSGLVHYPGTCLPAQYDGAFFLVDFRGGRTNSGVHQFYLEPNGATYKLKEYKPFVTNVLATDCDFGPSGDFYILDWVEGWDGPGVGRVHRVRCDDPKIEEQRREFQDAMNLIPGARRWGLLVLLNHANQRVRMAAQQAFVSQGSSAVETLVANVKARDPKLQLARIHAAWALGQLAMKTPAEFNKLAACTNVDDAEVRAQVARALGWASRCDEGVRNSCGEALVKLLADESPRVRSLAEISLGRLKYAHALPQLMKLAEKDGEDPTLRHSVSMALAGGSTSEELVAAAKDANDLQRLVIVVALGKQKSPLLAKFLTDSSDRVVLEAARLIWDTPVPEARPALAALIANTKLTSGPLLRRVIAANVAERSPEHLQAVVNLALREGTSDSLQKVAWAQIRDWAKPSSRDSVIGEWRPIEPRPDAEVVAVLEKSLDKIKATTESNPVGLIVAAELGVKGAYEPLIEVLANTKVSDENRVRAIGAFKTAADDVTRKAIDVAIKSRTPTVRAATRKLWSERFPSQVIEQLDDALKNGMLTEQQSALETLAGLNSPAAYKLLGERMTQLESGQCPADLQLDVLEAAGKSSDADLAARNKAFLAKVEKASVLERYANCLTGGDVERGKKLFETNDTLACRRCHSVKRGEVLVGPCLANVGGDRKPSDILESILTPNAKIVEGFETAVLELDTGKIVTGIIRKEDKGNIELIDAQAKTIQIDPATVENRVKGKSPMPENLMEQMKPRELRDLVAYLSQLKTRAPKPRRAKK